MSAISDHSRRVGPADSSSKFKCLFCCQQLPGSIGGCDRANRKTGKSKENDSERSFSSGGRGGGGQGDRIPPMETLCGGMEIMRKSLQVDSMFSEGDEGRAGDLGNTIVDEVCCSKCFATVENLVTIQEKINALEASKWELVKLLQTLIIKSEQSQKSSVTSTNAVSWGPFTQFREQVSKGATTGCLLKTECETCPSPMEFSEDIFPESPNESIIPPDDDVGVSSSSQTLSEADLQPVVKLEKMYPPSANNSLYNFRHNTLSVNYRDDIGNDSGDEFSPPQSPLNNEELESSGSEEFSKSGKIVKKRSSGRKRGRPPKTKVIVDNVDSIQEKRKRGRPKKSPLLVSSRTRRKNAEFPRKRGRPRKIDNTNEDEGSQNESKKRKRTHESQQQSANETAEPDRPKKPRLKEDGPAFKPIYVLNQSEGEFIFLSVRFKITPTSFLCQHPACYQEVKYVGHFTEQTIFQEMRFHIQQQHRGGSNQYRQMEATTTCYSCCHCQLELDSRPELTKHCEEQHSGLPMPLVVCEVCGLSIPEKELIEHIITHKSPEEKAAIAKMSLGRLKRISRPLEFPCDQCHKSYQNPTELRLHRDIHVPLEQRKRHICDLCGELSLNGNTLKIHIRTVHFKDKQPRPYACPYCSQKYLKTQKPMFEAHVRSHTGEKPFQCEECGKGFGSKAKFKVHKQTHVNASVPCQYCGQIYKSNKYLRKHHKKHHPDLLDWSKVKQRKSRQEKEYFGPTLMHPCEPCGHVYKYKSILVAHLKNKHDMRFERNEDYPTMWTWEDNRGIKGWK